MERNDNICPQTDNQSSKQILIQRLRHTLILCGQWESGPITASACVGLCSRGVVAQVLNKDHHRNILHDRILIEQTYLLLLQSSFV